MVHKLRTLFDRVRSACFKPTWSILVLMRVANAKGAVPMKRQRRDSACPQIGFWQLSPDSSGIMIKIMAHRANLTGPHSVAENSLTACAKALQLGFGLETDLRRDVASQFYISHDTHPRTSENSLEGYSELFSKHPEAELAINVKELGYEGALIDLMSSGRLGKSCFYFDFELLEPKHAGAAQRRIR